MAELKRCIGSARFGIDPHEAAIADFPKQPSQKDGLGRMCKAHWNQYTAGLARDAKARNALSAAAAPAVKAPRAVHQATRAKASGRTAPPKAAKAEQARTAPSRRWVRPVADELAAVAEVATEA